jgi:hypothetical protein
MTYVSDLISRLSKVVQGFLSKPTADAVSGSARPSSNEKAPQPEPPQPTLTKPAVRGPVADPAEPGVHEEVRELADVVIRVRETRPGFFVATLRPTSPETHVARGGYSLDTAQGLRGRTFDVVLDRAEAHWRRNYPS